jgi:putative NADH-flavin reductase
MNITIFGANGRTGRILTQSALTRGHQVTAVTRRPATFPLQDARLSMAEGDVNDLAAVERAIGGSDAVLSALGVPYTFRRITVYSKGTGNIIDAMRERGLRRLIVVSSTAAEPRYDNGGGFMFEHVLKPLIARTIGRSTYADQRRMEALVTTSGLDWTIVRPSGLFATERVTDYETTASLVTGKFTSRQDLADSMLRELEQPQYVREAMAVATVSVQPKLSELILREALHIKPTRQAPEQVATPRSPRTGAIVGG